ncbi:MAG: hypothetical protein SFV15_25595 [Polyangiaceae bacterium]|nr:hypothetical protein [Polyangiaceae bacterium]
MPSNSDPSRNQPPPFSDPIPPTNVPGDCGLSQPAFCETFDAHHPGGRGGHIDETRWSFARWTHTFEKFWHRAPASTYPNSLFPATFCGQPFSGLLPPDDVRVCPGVGVDGVLSNQLNEVFDDQEDFGFISMRVRQPFDFTDGGTVVWDVDAKVNPYHLGHGWFMEMWITEDPAPMPYHEAPTVASIPRKGLGLAFRFGGGCPQSPEDWRSALETVHVMDDYRIIHSYEGPGALDHTSDNCIRVADTKLNHFELRLAKDRLELWASDYDDPQNTKLRTVVNDLDLTFTRGYVHFQHAAYNAAKDCNCSGCDECGDPPRVQPLAYPSRSQTYRWDNLGFDGPTYPTPRAYDVPDNDLVESGGLRLGWLLGASDEKSFTIPGVNLSNALAASLNLTAMIAAGNRIEHRWNGGTWQSFVVPRRAGLIQDERIRSFSLPVPLSDLVAGSNKVDIRLPDGEGVLPGIGNLDLTFEVSQ